MGTGRFSLIVLILSLTVAAISSSPSTADRLADIEQSLEARRQTIKANPNDPQRWSWQADQASELYFEYLAHEGWGLTGLFGQLSQEQKQLAAAAAREMYECATAADAAVRKAITDLEAVPGMRSDAALQQQRRDLVETQRDRRIPFLQGISAYLHSQLNPLAATDRRRLLEQADQLLSQVVDSLEGAAARDARLYAGLAKAERGEFDAAEALFAAVARDAQSSPAQVFIARMGGVVNRTRRGGPQAGLDALNSVEPRYTEAAGGSSDVFFRVVIADHRFLLRRDEDLALALSAYLDLLKSETRVPRDVLRSIVFSKLANATADLDDATIAALPGLAIVARADHLSHDAATRAKAVVMIENALGSGRLDAAARAAALFVLGRALYEHGQRLLAAQRFIELAANHTTDVQSQRAVELGVTIAGDLHRSAPTNSESQALYREGLNLLLKRYANLPTIDRWRYAAAQLALEESRFDEADALLTQITPDAPEWVEAHFMQAAVARARALTADATDNAHRAFHEKIIAIIEKVRPIVEQGLHATTDEAIATMRRTNLGLLRVYLAEAQFHLSQPHLALQMLQGIEGESFGAAVVSSALKVRIDAYQAMKQPDDAMRELERFVQTSPEQTGAVLVPMLGSMQRDMQTMIDTGREEQAASESQRTLLPTAQLLERWLDAQREASDSARAGPLRIAQAYLLSGKYADSLSRFDALLTADPDRAELLLGKAESLFALGTEEQLAGAMPIYKRLAAAGPDSSADDQRLYWLSQWRMLQIIDRVNRHTEQILPRIERLRQQDPSFGGERYRRGFDSLRTKHAQHRS